MRCSPILVLTAALLPAAAVPAQTITSLSDPVLPHSGRLVVHGQAFGGSQGESRITIDGIDAAVSSWSNTKIRAYVPESAAVGSVQVQVITSGASNTRPLSVTTRPPAEGRIKWRFTADDSAVRTRPAVAPDGTIYVTGYYGHLYALTPDGGLKWIRSATSGLRSPSLGSDGTIYVGGGGGVTAVNPDGTDRWSYAPVGTLFLGPNVGPDGNIYGGTDRAFGLETGAFSLSPEGDLLFSFPGHLDIDSGPALPWEIVFGPTGQWYATSGMGGPPSNDYGIYAFAPADGGHLWLRGGLGQATTGATGHVTVNDPSNNSIASYDADGNERWRVSLNDLAGAPSNGALGPDDTYYLPVPVPGRLHAIDANGAVKWTIDPVHRAAFPIVHPDNTMVLAGGYSPSWGTPSNVQAFDPQTGDLLFEVPLDLDLDDEIHFSVPWYGALSNDGRTMYVGATGGAYVDEPYTYVYAIDVSMGPSSDLDGDGIVDFGDLVMLLAAWGPCAGCPADLDGDGVVSFEDLLVLLADWS